VSEVGIVFVVDDLNSSALPFRFSGVRRGAATGPQIWWPAWAALWFASFTNYKRL